MRKNLRKILLLIIFVILSMTLTISLAKTDVVIKSEKQNSTPIKQTDINLTKEIENINKDTNEIKMKLSLDAYKDVTNTLSSSTEIVFLLDNSGSMKSNIDNQMTRKSKVIQSVKQLTTKIRENNSNVKIGIVQFSDDGKTLCAPTNDENKILSALSSYEKANGNGTNIYKGLVEANKSFSTGNKSKTLVLLTDGVSSISVEETRKELQRDDIYTITVLAGLKNNSDSAIVQKIFGTEENPVADKFYNIEDANIANTISENIYNNIIETSKPTITNIILKDYFPDEILKNFDITINNTTKGKANLKDNNIEWNIEKLLNKENATLEYTLKLKNNYDENLIDKIIDTNKEVSVSYINDESQNKENKLTNSPQIKISSTKEDDSNKNNSANTIKDTNNTVNNNTNTNRKNIVDNTVTSSKKLPNAGNKGVILLVGIIMLIIVIIIQKINLKRFE